VSVLYPEQTVPIAERTVLRGEQNTSSLSLSSGENHGKECEQDSEKGSASISAVMVPLALAKAEPPKRM
jgi:hypothetical protein